MKWKKLGLVYVAAGERDWAISHAMLPTPLLLDDDRLRIYVAFLDRHGVGRIGYVDVDAGDPTRVLKVSDTPVLDLGMPGTFDDHGVTPMCALRHEGRIYLYYTGWQLGTAVRYYLFTGLAVSTDGGERFIRHSQAPILDRSNDELFFRSAAHVRRDGGVWRMWYVGGGRWVDAGPKKVPTYTLRLLESTDPTQWGPTGEVLFELDAPDEHGFGRPFVIRDTDRYRLFYSIRTFKKGYRLGYAESADGRRWTRMDDGVGIDVSEHGWDSEMVCYSCVQTVNSSTYLFYNGNNFGETGFGAARLEESV